MQPDEDHESTEGEMPSADECLLGASSDVKGGDDFGIIPVHYLNWLSAGGLCAPGNFFE